MATANAYNNSYNIHDTNLETFALLWLDAAVNTSEENREAQQELRSSINHVTTFEDGNLCQQYIRTVDVQDRLVLIVSGRLGQEVVPHIHQARQLSSIYVYCMDKERNEKWAKKFTKVKAVTVELDDLISRIKADQKKRGKIEDPIAINIFRVNENPEQSTTGVNGGFIHSLLIIDVLLRMKSVKTDKQELINLCKIEYKGNPSQLAIIHEFENHYSPEKALWWYSRESFLYRMLNKALRVQNIDVLFLFRFFICDIHRSLEQNRCQSPIHAYRGQFLSNEELNNLRKSVGDLISVNSFFSATVKRHQALRFLNSSDIPDDLHRVLFKINADPGVVTTKPFANISAYSEFTDESEVLFMIGSIFRLGDIYQSNDQIWIIQLTLCGDGENDLKTLFEHMKKTYGGGDDSATLLDFGRVLRRMGKFDLAEKFYRRLLNELPSDDPSLSTLYYSLGLVLRDKNDLDSSLQCLHKSLEIKLQTSPHNSGTISNCYNVIGSVYRIKGDYNIALSWYQKGIELIEQEDAPDHLKMAHFYNNMAIVYSNQNKYVEALTFNRKALVIREKQLPPNHPDIGLSHSNTGSNHRCLGHYDLALQHYNQSLDIMLKSLPPHHPHVAKSYTSIGLIHADKGELKQALEYLGKAATIHRQSLPSGHPDVVKAENDIKRISSKLT